MSPVQFYFDPACPWTWITSRWVVDVAGQRQFDITWLPFSLRHRNIDNPGYDRIRDELDAQHPGMRVIEAARHQYGNAAVGRLYTAFGTLIHHDRDDNLTRLAEGIAMAKLPPVLIDAATDDSFDAGIIASTEAGRALVGDDAGIPIVVIDGAQSTFFGPVLSPAPTGAEAVELWDAFVTLGRFDGLYEIKRTRSVGPIFGPRP
ncbi:MAG: disulfide bond formation protein DsbA [Acidimicrobiales bacterium]|jgi:hypothetical protein|nr:disulfide bond formation protein DsbA [Acidimicrobiales bacterium]